MGYVGGQVYLNSDGGTLFFNANGESDIQGYSIGTTLENVNGNYTKLTIDWHTGIRIGAASAYGGIRFYNNSVKYYGGSQVFSVADGDNNVRVNNILFVSGDVRAPIYYDSANTGYYLDAGGGSYLASSLEIANGYFLSNGVGGTIWMSSVQGSFGGYMRFGKHAVIETISSGFNVYVLDSGGIGVVKNSGSQSWSAFSDITLKTVHSVMEDNLSKLDRINPIYYSFNNFADDKNRIGLIAQEVQEYFPELVELEPRTEKLVLDYTGLIPVLLGAIKELKKEIDILKAN
jgi:hypothetical protein